MDNQLQYLVNQHSQHFDNWADAMNEHNELMFSVERTNEPARFHLATERAANTLASIFGIIKKYGKFKDDWNDGQMTLNMYGFDVIIESQKMRTEFFLGIDEKGLYLRAELNNEINLKNMSDDFWKKLLALTDYEGFEFNQYESCSREASKEYPDLFYSYKGTVFQIFRKYFFDYIDPNPQSSGMGSLGEFRVTWTGKTPFDIIIAELCLVFKAFYELKYALWKVDDLKQKKGAKAP